MILTLIAPCNNATPGGSRHKQLDVLPGVKLSWESSRLVVKMLCGLVLAASIAGDDDGALVTQAHAPSGTRQRRNEEQ